MNPCNPIPASSIVQDSSIPKAQPININDRLVDLYERVCAFEEIDSKLNDLTARYVNLLKLHEAEVNKTIGILNVLKQDPLLNDSITKALHNIEETFSDSAISRENDLEKVV